MSIEAYISKLESYKSNLQVIVTNIAVKKEAAIINMAQGRLFNQGVDGKKHPMGSYLPVSIILKKAKKPPQRTDHITLKDTGKWYDEMFVSNVNGGLFLDSDNWKTAVLEERFGVDILGLTEEETDALVVAIDPELELQLNSNLPDIDI